MPAVNHLPLKQPLFRTSAPLSRIVNVTGTKGNWILLLRLSFEWKYIYIYIFRVQRNSCCIAQHTNNSQTIPLPFATLLPSRKVNKSNSITSASLAGASVQHIKPVSTSKPPRRIVYDVQRRQDIWDAAGTSVGLRDEPHRTSNALRYALLCATRPRSAVKSIFVRWARMQI